MNGTRRRRGLTLLEVMVALGILSIMALGLFSLIISSQGMTNLTRERSIAANAIRAWIETGRSQSLSSLLNSTTTPADYVMTLAGQPNVLKNAKGEVFLVNYENGTSGVLVSGAAGAGTLTTTQSVSTLSYPLSTTLLGFTSGGLDLTGAGTFAGNPATTANLLRLPVRVRLQWTSATSNATNPSDVQNLVEYVVFSNP
jgi:prepilin-type N-terminal cleavage/methylation domain-containing protein